MAETPKPTRMIGVSQAAAELGVSPNTLRAWVDKGLVPAVRLPSGARRFTREQLDDIKAQMFGRRRSNDASGRRTAAAA